MDVKTHIAQLELDGLSKTRGNILILTFGLDGRLRTKIGNFYFRISWHWIQNFVNLNILEGMNTIFKIHLSRKMKGGVYHLEMSKFELDFAVKNVVYQVDDPDDPEKGRERFWSPVIPF